MLSSMKIRTKLLLLAVFLVFLIFAVGIYGLFTLNGFNQNLGSSLASANISNEAVDAARSAQVSFKIQVQEWKNILIRGNDPESLKKYSTSFSNEETEVQKELAQLKELMRKQNLNTDKIDEAIKGHSELGTKYKEALKSYNPANPESFKIVDNMVKGIDRAPTEAIDVIVAQIQEYNNKMFEESKKKSVSDFNRSRNYIIVFLLLSVSIAIGLAALITRQIVMPIKLLNRELSNLAESGGDLTQEIRIYSKDEIGNLAQAVNKFIANLRTIIIEINKSAKVVAETAQQLNSNAQQTTAGANETASTMGEIAGTVEQITTNVQEISGASKLATENASDGDKGVARVNGQMQVISGTTTEVASAIGGLNKKALEISQIVELITSIADQTNLLALNAAIEAARAGEQGRGFAVVADEVRKLAEQSGSAAKDIYSLINAIQMESQKAVEAMSSGGREVESGRMIVQEVGDKFKEIIRSVQDLTSQIQEVAYATEQMSAGVQNVAASTEEQTAAMEEISASAESLSGLAEGFRELVAKFKV